MNTHLIARFAQALIFIAICTVSARAQVNDYNKTVQVQATVDPDAISIQLGWPEDLDAGSFNIYRRVPGSSTWGPIFEALDGTATTYLDTDIELGEIYEYRVSRGSASGIANGYIYAGIEVPVSGYRGRLLVVLDNTFTDLLAPEIEIMLEDFRADGWEVATISVSPVDLVSDVKSQIISWYDLAPTQSRAVFLFGHIPVPYSGNIGPDGHPDHVGAWPADCFYGDMDGTWTDISVNTTSASQVRNHNIPGDGKYDNSYIATDLELGIGRVDFFNMPTFSESEEELLRRYILKSHAFKRKVFDPVRRGLIENNFGSFEEGFGQNGLKNFTAMFGRDSVSYIDYSTLYSESYLWSYGCGGGSYTSASGIGNTGNFAADSLQTVFTMLFGSYFGDWDSGNNFLRAALASGTTLSNAWAARPNWEFHPMALGFPIGDCARLTINNLGSSYDPGFGNRQIHVALMGDPTLRMHMVSPPTALTLEEVNGHVLLNWLPSGDEIVGYNIYRKRVIEPIYSLVNDFPIADLSYVDSCLTFGEVYDYYVKAVKLETSASGTYFNESLGIGGAVEIETDNTPVAGFEVVQVGGEIQLVNNSSQANGYLWMFGDGGFSEDETPIYNYGGAGEFTITLTAFGDCSNSTFSQTITVTSSSEILAFNDVIVLPNPVADKLFLDCSECSGKESISVFDVAGRQILTVSTGLFLQGGLDVSSFPEGLYYLELSSGKGHRVFQFIKI
ncbi:MAG: T9SS type A sorting domain-containing protein [Saprospiraceae bacterium]|nr:T9SS type A sorting domain-containing protein [Saprospiraceae bacterium]